MSSSSSSSRDPNEILDFDRPFDVEFFDKLVEAFFSSQNTNKTLHDAITNFQNNQNSWKRCPDIIQKSKLTQSRILALNILKQCTMVQWNVLPETQKVGMKAFLEELILKVAKDRDMDMRGPFVQKLNEVLIAIVKREWPHNWPNFVSQVCEVSKKSEPVCINNIGLLRLLCEEASENVGDLTHSAQEDLRKNLHKEFNKVFDLCMFVMKNSKNNELLIETFSTLAQFLRLKWIPITIIFESSLIEALALQFYDINLFRVNVLECLVEITSIPSSSITSVATNPQLYYDKLAHMFLKVLKSTIGKYDMSDKTNFNRVLESSEANRVLVQHLTNFLTTMFSNHHHILETKDDHTRSALEAGLRILLKLTDVDDQTIFQICLDYWEKLSRDLEKNLPQLNSNNSFFSNMDDGETEGNQDNTGDSIYMTKRGKYETDHPRYRLYAPALHHLKLILMRRIPRPKEVLVVQDDLGNTTKEELKDTIALAMHIQISKILWILSSIDPIDSRDTISDLLEQIDRNIHDIHFGQLQSLCWSIGAVANSMPESDEKTFLVLVIKILLKLCERQRSKDAKAIIAACIMYVVRKYPKFLRRHWKFLQTVVRKLVEFLHETHPGVQDMSIEALEEIARHCGAEFLTIQKDDVETFWEELMRDMHGDMMNELTLEQQENLYFTWGVVVSKCRKKQEAPRLIGMLLKGANQKWQYKIELAKKDPQKLEQQNVVTELLHLLRIFKSTARSVGGAFIVQLGAIYLDMLHLYDFYARRVSQELAKDNPSSNNSQSPKVKAMRTIKSEILQVVEAFVAKSAQTDQQQIVEKFVPKFLDVVLTDYEKCVPQAREASCLAACCALVDRFGPSMGQYVQGIFKSVFQITLNMLKNDLQSYPDHRKNFFRLLLAVSNRCFDVFKHMSPDQLQIIIQCIMWGMEHYEGNISETSARTLSSLLSNIRQDRKIATKFYHGYLKIILQKLLQTMTDNLHKSVFPLLCDILREICVDIQNPNVCDDLMGPTKDEGSSGSGEPSPNVRNVGQLWSRLLNEKFPNLTPQVINNFVMNCFIISLQTKDKRIYERTEIQYTHPFMQCCQDLLVQIKKVHQIKPPPKNT